MTIPIEQQIEEVNRELAMRAKVYPGLIARGRMRKSEADHAVARMQAIKATLEFCRDNRALIARLKAEERS